MKITTLPEELYDKIFKELGSRDLNQCQRVCRAWRSSAHIAFLQEINIFDDTNIEAFIRAIDYNPNSIYLNAVKKITINVILKRAPGIHLDQEAVRKLFFRFPNLTDVHLEKCLDWFEAFDNQRFCAEFLECCPKLESFRTRDLSHSSHWHLRHLLTSLSIDFRFEPSDEDEEDNEDEEEEERYEKEVGFLSSFPRLKELHCEHDYFDTLGQILPIFEHSPAITSIQMSAIATNDNFGYDYLYYKSNEEKAIIFSKLSQIKKLYLEYFDYFAKEGVGLLTMEFIRKYMTSLTSFIVVKYNDSRCDDPQVQPFCSRIVDPVDSSVPILHISGIHHMDLPTCFPVISNNVFANTSADVRVLCVDADNFYHWELRLGEASRILRKPEFIHLQIGMAKGYIKLDFPQQSASFIQRFFTSEINNVDVFKLVIRSNFAFEYLIDGIFFTNILNRLPVLKEAILDIAGICRQPSQTTDYQEFEMIVNRHMEKITLRVKDIILAMLVLDRLVFMFPNLEQLNLYYYSGIWDNSLSEFYLGLENYKLKSLGIDVTPVKSFLKNQQFILIKVESLHKLHLFKVCRYLCSFTTIQDDLIDIFANEDQIWVHIVIKEVKQLELWMYNIPWGQAYNTYLHQDVPDDGFSLEESVLDSRLLKHLIIPIE